MCTHTPKLTIPLACVFLALIGTLTLLGAWESEPPVIQAQASSRGSARGAAPEAEVIVTVRGVGYKLSV
jgi:hypothetical protein